MARVNAKSLANLAPAWQPGVSPNPAGRPQGARSKLNELALRHLLNDFTEHGQAVIAKVRDRKPEQYLAAVVSLLPRQAQKLDSPFTDLSDDELNQLSDLLSALRAKTVNDLARVAPKPTKPKPELYTETLAPLRTAHTTGTPAELQQNQGEGSEGARPRVARETERSAELVEPLEPIDPIDQSAVVEELEPLPPWASRG